VTVFIVTSAGGEKMIPRKIPEMIEMTVTNEKSLLYSLKILSAMNIWIATSSDSLRQKKRGLIEKWQHRQ
jgi:hypothetical protein